MCKRREGGGGGGGGGAMLGFAGCWSINSVEPLKRHRHVFVLVWLFGACMQALFGLAMFQWVLDGDMRYLYGMYMGLVTVTILLTLLGVREIPIPVEVGQPRAMFTWLPWKEVKSSYYLTPSKHGDFFWVTVSRTFYYMGISSQVSLVLYTGTCVLNICTRMHACHCVGRGRCLLFLCLAVSLSVSLCVCVCVSLSLSVSHYPIFTH